MLRISFFLLSLALIEPIFSQNYKLILEEKGQEMLTAKTEIERRNSLAEFTKRIDSLLSKDEGFFDADLKEVKSLSSLKSSDNRIRIFTWNIPLDDGTYKYFGRILLHGGKLNKVIPLKAIENNSGDLERKRLNLEMWKGAIYYDIIKKKHRKNTYYTLLGWDGNNSLSTKKVIEILKVSKKGQLTLGAPILVERKVLNRKIFEYSKKASMSLKYDSKKDRIVFDHLAPINNTMLGMFEFYSPDFTYDAYVWKKGRWFFEKNIDARNENLNEGNKTKPIEKGLRDN